MRPSALVLLGAVLLLTRPSYALLSGETPALGGTNVIVGDEVRYVESDSLPYLKPETRITSYGAVANDAFDGIIQVGATLSLDPDDGFYVYGLAVRRSIQMFADLVNYEADAPAPRLPAYVTQSADILWIACVMRITDFTPVEPPLKTTTEVVDEEAERPLFA